MLPPIHALYNCAAEQWHTASRLLDSSEYSELRECNRLTEQQREALLGRLTGEERRLFERYMENRDTAAELEGELYFGRGLAAGLQLGSLAVWG